MKMYRGIRKILQTITAPLITLPVLAFAQDQSTSPITSAQGVIDLAARISQWVSTIFWIVAGIMVLYGGFLYMTASGDSEKVGKAHRQLLYAVIAIAVGILSAGLPALVKSFLGGQ